MKTEREREKLVFLYCPETESQTAERETGIETDRQSVSQRETEAEIQTDRELRGLVYDNLPGRFQKVARLWSELRGRPLLRRFLNGDPPPSKPLCAFSLTLPPPPLSLSLSLSLLSRRQPRWGPIILCLTQPML